LWGKFHPEILKGSPSGGVKQERGEETSHFSGFKSQYLENGRRYVQSYY